MAATSLSDQTDLLTQSLYFYDNAYYKDISNILKDEISIFNQSYLFDMVSGMKYCPSDKSMKKICDILHSASEEKKCIDFRETQDVATSGIVININANNLTDDSSFFKYLEQTCNKYFSLLPNTKILAYANILMQKIQGKLFTPTSNGIPIEIPKDVDTIYTITIPNIHLTQKQKVNILIKLQQMDIFKSYNKFAKVCIDEKSYLYDIPLFKTDPHYSLINTYKYDFAENCIIPDKDDVNVIYKYSIYNTINIIEDPTVLAESLVDIKEPLKSDFQKCIDNMKFEELIKPDFTYIKILIEQCIDPAKDVEKLLDSLKYHKDTYKSIWYYICKNYLHMPENESITKWDSHIATMKQNKNTLVYHFKTSQ
jgi:hypothetical protein